MTTTIEAGELDFTVLGVEHIDPATGRRWLMMNDRAGFTRTIEGTWVYVRNGDHSWMRPTIWDVTSKSTLELLNRWERRHLTVDHDPTPATGITIGAAR